MAHSAGMAAGCGRTAGADLHRTGLFVQYRGCDNTRHDADCRNINLALRSGGPGACRHSHHWFGCPKPRRGTDGTQALQGDCRIPVGTKPRRGTDGTQALQGDCRIPVGTGLRCAAVRRQGCWGIDRRYGPCHNARLCKGCGVPVGLPIDETGTFQPSTYFPLRTQRGRHGGCHCGCTTCRGGRGGDAGRRR